MKKFKYIVKSISYKTILSYPSFEDWLNSYGKEGWEVAAINCYNGVEFPAYVVFKKEIKDIKNDR